jgi:glycosyltransferase XagB
MAGEFAVRGDGQAGDLPPDIRARLADDAAHGLARSRPELSAHIVITRAQAVTLAFVVCAMTAALVAMPGAWQQAMTVLSFVFLAGVAFRAFLALIGRRALPAAALRAGEPLPVYTILVPLLREANVLPRLARALLLLDYPHDRLDIKWIVEEDDPETLAAACALDGRGPFEIVCVPKGKPQTKPRALNFALNFAKGEFAVVYDAEDRPERDQLRKAVAAFRAGPDTLACLQARLNFYNARETWLTRLFALDYALWFDAMLPALDRLGVPMPLGGTSNHFRIEVLRALGGWDAFNVTEDADLGIRIAQLGRRVAMLDSTTFEEAPVRFGVWLKQRTRWVKGYVQTWLVHTRRPWQLLRQAGPLGFLAFHLFIGGSVLTALAALPLWGFFAWSVLQPHGPMALPFVAFAAGNLLLTALAMASPVRRGWHDLSPAGLGIALYWAMISLAALRALPQLVHSPFHWEKTAHGLSRK